MTKSDQHEAIRERARAALRDLYHNATPNYPRLDDEAAERFQSWFDDAAQFEIEYLKDGGAYGRNYRKTLAADCNAGRYKSEAARRYYVVKGMRAREMEQADCGALTGWRVLELAVERCGTVRPGSVQARIRTLRNRVAREGWTRNNAQWERINDYGTLYTYGRGGRTLAPDGLIGQRGGGSFSIREDYADEMPIAAVVDLIRVLESFNAYVAAWCKSVPQQWADVEKDRLREERAQRRAAREATKNDARRAEMARAFC